MILLLLTVYIDFEEWYYNSVEGSSDVNACYEVISGHIERDFIVELFTADSSAIAGGIDLLHLP